MQADYEEVQSTGPSRAQLTQTEHLLRREDQRRLAPERAEQKRLLDARPGSLSVVDVLNLARNNTLAQQNQYGGALVLLQPELGPDANLNLVDSYLQHVSCVREGHLRDRVQRRIDLVCHYLLKTGWFEGAYLGQLAHVANKLSKFADDSAPCRATLGWIARRVCDQYRDVWLLQPHCVAIMANALSKEPRASWPAARKVCWPGVEPRRPCVTCWSGRQRSSPGAARRRWGPSMSWAMPWCRSTTPS